MSASETLTGDVGATPMPPVAEPTPAPPSVAFAVIPDALPVPSAVSEESAPPAAAPPPPAMPAAASTDLEARLRRLEDALAQLQHTPPAPVARPVEVYPAAGHSGGGSLLDAGRRLLGGEPAAPAPVYAGLPAGSYLRPVGILLEMIADLRVVVRMYTDPRYRLSWTGKVVPAVLLVFIALSNWWAWPLAALPLLGGYFIKVLDLLLAYALFKVVGQEARYYRQTSPDLPRSLRL